MKVNNLTFEYAGVKTNFEIRHLFMKKELIVQFVALMLFFLDSIMIVRNEGLDVSNVSGEDFIYLFYHALLFLAVNYILIPRFFHKKKYGLFLLNLIALIVLFAVVEETVVERTISFETRGKDSLRWQSVYFFFAENMVPLLGLMTIKIMFDFIGQRKRMEQIEKDNLTNELKFLKSQIQPHILFNSLNNLYDFTLSKSDKAPDLVLQLSNVLRYVLYETSAERVTLSKELDFVKDYVNLQRMQFEGRGAIHFELNENNRKDDLMIAPFLLIPYIENSFKHSLGSKNDGIQVAIKIDVNDHDLSLMIENDFEKMATSPNDLIAKGIGLKNVKKRLKLLYPDHHDLQIQASGGKYKVQLKINFS